ncbi:MAG TPA: PAS domain-containing protein, partial [Polyangiaceae bacterium]|nr:PAS domain-containing protein [Polyangiaceae bacterium]
MRLELEQYAALIGSMPLGLVAFRLEDASDARSLRLLDWNQAASDCVGVDFAEFEGRSLPEILPELDASELEACA